MNVNSISNTNTTPATTSKPTNTDSKVATNTPPQNTSGVVYEKSTPEKNTTYKVANKDLIAQLKADADAKTSQLRDLVTKMMTQQGSTIGNSDSIWRFLAKGDFTVDAATKAQAQKDIAADGYWGVNQTSTRIVDFAKALTGGNPAQAEKMRSAFEKGFREATKSWGKELPKISKDTYDSTMKQFDAWVAESNAATAK